MKFMELVSSAKSCALGQAEEARAKEVAVAARNADRMRELNTRLHEISSDLERISATLSTSEVSSMVCVRQGRFSLAVHMTFTEVWMTYLLSIEESGPSSFEERSDKAVTVEDAIRLLAQSIGRFQAK